MKRTEICCAKQKSKENVFKIEHKKQIVQTKWNERERQKRMTKWTDRKRFHANDCRSVQPKPNRQTNINVEIGKRWISHCRNKKKKNRNETKRKTGAAKRKAAKYPRMENGRFLSMDFWNSVDSIDYNVLHIFFRLLFILCILFCVSRIEDRNR